MNLKVKKIELSKEEFWSYEDNWPVWYWRIHLEDGTVITDEFYDQDPRYPQEHCYSHLGHARQEALKKARQLTGESYWRLWRLIEIKTYRNSSEDEWDLTS